MIDCGVFYDVNNNKNYIFSGDEDGFLCCWNIKENNNENPFKKKIIEGENCLSVLDVYNDFSDSNNNIVACGLNGDKNNSIYMTKLKENLNV